MPRCYHLRAQVAPSQVGYERNLTSHDISIGKGREDVKAKVHLELSQQLFQDPAPAMSLHDFLMNLPFHRGHVRPVQVGLSKLNLVLVETWGAAYCSHLGSRPQLTTKF